MATSKEKLQIIVDAQGIAKTKAQLKAMDKASGGATKSFGAMAAGIAGATVALYALGKATSFAIRVGKEFEQSMANVKAISGATGSEFSALEANARRLGASTKFTATEVAGLQTEFAKLGFTTTEINKVTKGTLALAAATGSDLATSAAVGGATLRGFGLDASETGRVTDVMAKSFSSSALDMQKFSDSMKYVAPVAKIAGFGIEGTTAMLGKLANAGIDGSMAGTALRKIFLELSNESSKLSKRLGGSVKSVDELIPALQKLNKEGVTTAEMKDMVGQRAISAFSILLSGADDVDTLAESLNNAGGSAQKMADIQLDTLEGKMTIMNSAMEGLGIAIGDKLSPAIQDAVEGFTSMIGTLTNLRTKGDQAFLKFDDMSDALSQAHINATQVRGEFDQLTKSLLYLTDQDELSNIQLERRDKIIDELQTKFPNYLSNLGQEAGDYFAISRQIQQARVELNKYLEAQIQAATATVFEKEIAETNAQLIKQQGYLEALEDPTQLFQLENYGTAKAVDITKRNIENLNAQLQISTKSYQDATTAAEQMKAGIITPEDLMPPGNGDGKPPVIPGVPSDEEMANALMLMVEYQTSLRDIKITAAEQELSDEEQKLLRSNEILGDNEEIRNQIIADFGEKRTTLEKKIDDEQLKLKQDQYKKLAGATVGFLSQFSGSAVLGARIQQTMALIDTYSGATAALAPPPKGAGPIKGIPLAATIIMTGLAQVMQISKSIGEFKTAATGMDEIVSKPTMILAGEAGPESVNITPLDSIGDTGGGGGSSVTLNISAPLVDETVVDSIIPALREALRRGETLESV